MPGDGQPSLWGPPGDQQESRVCRSRYGGKAWILSMATGLSLVVCSDGTLLSVPRAALMVLTVTDLPPAPSVPTPLSSWLLRVLRLLSSRSCLQPCPAPILPPLFSFPSVSPWISESASSSLRAYMAARLLPALLRHPLSLLLLIPSTK